MHNLEVLAVAPCSRMMRAPASTCTCRTLATCENSLWEDSVGGMEWDSNGFGISICPLCSASSKCCESRQTKSSSQPKVLLSYLGELLQNFEFLELDSQLAFLSASVVRIRCKTIDLSLHCKLVNDPLSAVMAHSSCLCSALVFEPEGPAADHHPAYLSERLVSSSHNIDQSLSQLQLLLHQTCQNWIFSLGLWGMRWWMFQFQFGGSP